MRRLIPYFVKVQIKQFLRNRQDRKTGDTLLFAKAGQLKNNHSPQISIAQPIHPNPLSSNKVHNIKLAIEKIEPLVINPGEVFSFWRSLGKPTASKGFLSGRNIIGNSLSEDIGGGLCQVSGILYHLALLGGLEIKERHNHTIDLYQEHERYTPIGTDATVVYAYKDFRFKNSLKQAVSFRFDVSESSFSASLCSDNPIFNHQLRFEREDQDKMRYVKTFRTDSSGKESYIHLSVYKL